MDICAKLFYIKNCGIAFQILNFFKFMFKIYSNFSNFSILFKLKLKLKFEKIVKNYQLIKDSVHSYTTNLYIIT